jgi:3-oxoacyl-[acyl-carrier protein] reductase
MIRGAGGRTQNIRPGIHMAGEHLRTALVTGGSGAIGAAVCRALAAQGNRVIVHANTRMDEARALADALTAAGGTAQAIAFDVTDRAAAGAALAALEEAGPVQILVNNAGIYDDAPMAGMSAGQWDRVIGNRGQTNYAAAKAGLHGATKSLALELASRGITVNAVAPGVIASPILNGAFPQEQIDALVPMKRAGTPEEVAALVAFLASDAAAYITGQVVSINGGMA